jgi:hypothetical protein
MAGHLAENHRDEIPKQLLGNQPGCCDAVTQDVVADGIPV